MTVQEGILTNWSKAVLVLDHQNGIALSVVIHIIGGIDQEFCGSHS